MLSTAVRTVEVTKGWLAFFENSRFLTASAKAEVMIVLSLFVNVARKESSPSSMELRNCNHLDHERDRCACVFSRVCDPSGIFSSSDKTKDSISGGSGDIFKSGGV